MGYGRDEFIARLHRFQQDVLGYEDRALQIEALRTVSVEELEEKTLVAFAKEGQWDVSEHEFQYGRLYQLLLWFKNSFKWVDTPNCENCGGQTVRTGNGFPTPEESRWRGDRVELSRCMRCYREVRFPRYNDPRKLLETRSGRCGEWANCFTLYCRALGYRTRLILDFTDHLWTECYFPSLGRWVHADPCEAVMDEPLLYERGWNKKLNYIIGFAHDGVRDVTKRYTRNWPQVLTRRTVTTEEEAEEVLMLINIQMRADVSSQDWDELANMDAEEDKEIATAYEDGASARKQLPGRQTGSEAWRIARGEIGNHEGSTSESPDSTLRLCVDEHVAAFRGAVGLLWSDLSASYMATWKVLEGLKALDSFLKKLKSQPIRKRALELDTQSEEAWLSKARPGTIDALLNALSLGRSEEDGKMRVLDLENPVKTALALAAALEFLERYTRDMPTVLMEKWLTHGTRLCGGLVYASGEYGPHNLTSAAFDGLSSTKWEEPNGAKAGGWIVYELRSTNRESLAAYEITSANDVPGRDPRDWILEGSDNKGRSWKSLDVRNGEYFPRRFMTKTYEVKEENRFPCDSFRLRIVHTKSSHDIQSLQLSCLDLFTSRTQNEDLVISPSMTHMTLD